MNTFRGALNSFNAIPFINFYNVLAISKSAIETFTPIQIIK
jgi:hypothetical protein